MSCYKHNVKFFFLLVLSLFLFVSCEEDAEDNGSGSDPEIDNGPIVYGFITDYFYDLDNESKLSSLLPEFIVEDSNNEVYLKFTDMIGQHFDFIWEYIKM